MASSWLSRLQDLGRGLLQLVYPGVCHVCAASLSADGHSLCEPCRTAVFTDPSPSCARCAATVGPHAHADGRCPLCRNQSFPFERVFRLGPYEGRLRDVVLHLKHHSGEGLAELLGELWADQARAAFQAAQADFVVPVPLHWWG